MIPCAYFLFQEEYKCIAQQWVKKKQGFILVYSLTDDVSFGHLKAFHDLIKEEYAENVEDSPGGKPPPIVLVGNKLDLERQRKVPHAQGLALANQWGAKFFEVRCVVLRFLLVHTLLSAKTSENIENAFHTLIRMMRMRERELKVEGSSSPNLFSSSPSAASGGGSSSGGGGGGGGGLFGCVLL